MIKFWAHTFIESDKDKDNLFEKLDDLGIKCDTYITNKKNRYSYINVRVNVEQFNFLNAATRMYLGKGK